MKKLIGEALQIMQWFFDTFFNDFHRFSASFWSQNRCKIDLRAEDHEKRKTFQNTGWASKNQGFASAKAIKNYEKSSSICHARKNMLKHCKPIDFSKLFGLLGGAF